MSGSNIAYHLRTHKAVDRRLFIDLLTRYERERPLENAAYLSMGAYSLEDHRLIHRYLGIKRLIAFDLDEDIVSRQQFNKPIDSCHCVKKTAGELVVELDAILASCNCSDATSVIVWLDYTDPKDIGSQVREFQSLLDKLREGDVVRVTVNANPKELQKEVNGAPVLVSKTMQKHFSKLQNAIGDYLPSTAKASDMTFERFAVLLSQAFASAALKALPASGRTVFAPLSVVRYADTTQMLSISGVIVARDKEEHMRASMRLSSWPFGSTGWTDVKHIIAPAITLRERLFLERSVMDKSDAAIATELGFSKFGATKVEEFLDSYRKYYRFYPTMLLADV